MSNRDAADRPDLGTPAFDVLGWWSAHEKIFPLMSKAAKKYLAIQATSCASERTFSTGGATVTTQRTKLDPTSDCLLVLSDKSIMYIVVVTVYVDVELRERLFYNCICLIYSCY